MALFSLTESMRKDPDKYRPLIYCNNNDNSLLSSSSTIGDSSSSRQPATLLSFLYEWRAKSISMSLLEVTHVHALLINLKNIRFKIIT